MVMKWRGLVVAGMLCLIAGEAAEQDSVPTGAEAIPAQYEKVAQQLVQAATSQSVGFERLALMCDRFGPRFSGSPNLEQAIDWILETMRQDGFEAVRGEPVSIPRWVRGEESLQLLTPRRRALPMLGLGGSIATPSAGIEADVWVVRDFEMLREQPTKARGKIVLFNAPFTEYRKTVVFRSKGAVEAAKAGAVASLIRSVGPFSMQTPHTGAMGYEAGVRRIPHAAITAEDADMLERMQSRGETVRVRLHMNAQTLSPGVSRNVVADWRGSELPEEIVLVSGHIDSWDVGTGAMDDGGGCLAAWEAIRLIQSLGLRPRRTLRVVLWTNEENGMGGVKTYRDQHVNQLGNHVLAMESDSGVFDLQGLSFTGSERAMPYLESIGGLLDSVGVQKISWGANVSDIMHLLAQGVPVMGLDVDREKYFWYHHTEADTIDKLDRGEFNRCVAAFAVMAYIVADMPDRLPR